MYYVYCLYLVKPLLTFFAIFLVYERKFIHTDNNLNYSYACMCLCHYTCSTIHYWYEFTLADYRIIMADKNENLKDFYKTK